MAAPIAMDVRPISTPHLDLDHLPLADKDFQIKDTTVHESPLKLYYRYKYQYVRNHTDKIGFWESNLSKYQFPKVHIFPKIVHYFHENYIPVKEQWYTLTKPYFSPSLLNQSMKCYKPSLAKN